MYSGRVPPGTNAPIQSPEVAAAFAIVAVTIPPAATVVALSVIVGGVPVTLIGALIARNDVLSLSYRRTSYTPGVDGIGTSRLPFAIPEAGRVYCPFKYRQSV